MADFELIDRRSWSLYPTLTFADLDTRLTIQGNFCGRSSLGSGRLIQVIRAGAAPNWVFSPLWRRPINCMMIPAAEFTISD